MNPRFFMSNIMQGAISMRTSENWSKSELCMDLGGVRIQIRCALMYDDTRQRKNIKFEPG